MVSVIGCGNILAGDDGIGVYLIRELGKRKFLKGVSVIEAGTPGLSFLDIIAGKDKVIIVDAVRSKKTGEIFWLKEKDLAEKEKNWISLHGLDLGDALKLGRKLEPEKMPGEIWIFGIGINGTQPGLGPSPKINKLLPELTRKLIKKIKDVA